MSDPRMDVVRNGIEAFSRGDFDAALEGFSPDIEWEMGSELVPDGKTYHGHEGVREFWTSWHQLFHPFTIEIEELVPMGDDRVLVLCRAHGQGAGSGVPVDSPRFYQLFEFRGDTVVAVRLHSEPPR